LCLSVAGIVKSETDALLRCAVTFHKFAEPPSQVIMNETAKIRPKSQYLVDKSLVSSICGVFSLTRVVRVGDNFER
jgi:hypothetical protein